MAREYDRVSLHNTQIETFKHSGEQTIKPMKVGIKVEFNQHVIDYYENADACRGGVVTEYGTRHGADMVIAADGVSSKSQALVGGQVRAISSGGAMWRAAFPIEHLYSNPEVKEFFSMINGEDLIVRTWLG
jgi:2-polyprenyl-6-methoxyphenol hydroxylase-like FAD-dependent oxidoreductase